jgi:hypothetical protein
VAFGPLEQHQEQLIQPSPQLWPCLACGGFPAVTVGLAEFVTHGHQPAFDLCAANALMVGKGRPRGVVASGESFVGARAGTRPALDELAESRWAM